MMKRKLLLSVVIIVGCMMSACGPSEEAIATMTAAAWTPTPEPTLTPTPLPFDLVVMLEGEGGEVVTLGTVEATEMEPVMIDENGKAELMNVPMADVTLSIIAQGFEPLEETVTLEHGKNELAYTLTVDSMQIMPSEACGPGQKILMIEDFEDQKVQAMVGNLTRPAWEFLEVEGRGTVLKANPAEGAETYIMFPEEYGNYVWHYEILRNADMGIVWMRFHQVDGVGAYIAVNDGGSGFGLQREPGPFIADRNLPVGDGLTWEKFSLVYFDGVIDIYKNDELHLGTSDDEPYEKGAMSIQVSPFGTGPSFDNLVVCGLTEAYVPPVVEVEEE
jgi:hypothetical protein